MNKKWIGAVVYCSVFFSAMGLVSCVDDAYDLNKDIDMTITVGGDLSLPGSNTEEITLKKIFDLEDDSNVQPDASGNYVLTQNGDRTTTTVTIDPVVVDGSGIAVDAAHVALGFDYNPALPEMTVAADVETKASFKIEKTDVTKDVVALKSATVDMPLQLVFDFSGNAEALYIDKGLTLSFPDYMTVSCNDSRMEVKDSNKLVFKEGTPIGRNGKLVVEATVTSVDFDVLGARGEGLVTPGHLVISGEMAVSGSAYLNSSEFDNTNHIDLELGADVEIDRMELKEAVAVVDPDINISVDPIRISNLPDFLNDESVTINLTDPRIYLTVTNPTPAAVSFKAYMIPVKDGQEMSGKEVSVGDVEAGDQPVVIPANAEGYVICIHRTSDPAGIDADLTVSVPDLNNLIEKIPDEIRMDKVEASAVQEYCTIVPGSAYTVETDYQISAPLQFNEGSEIVYSDQMDGWNDDVKDIDFKEGEIQLKATNTIPLSLEMTVDAIDVNGNVLDGVTAVVEGSIAAGTAGNPAVSDLKIRIVSDSAEALHRLDGLKYRVSAVTTAAVAGQTLNENQTLKLDDVRIKVMGGVTMDLN